VTPKKSVLNPGSVGFQVDGQKLARYILIDLPALHVKLMEVPYNPNVLFRRMRAQGYDERYFNSLNQGRWIGFSSSRKRIPIIIVGAGIYGQIIAELIEETTDKFAVGFVDDTHELKGQIIAGLPVLGTLSELDGIAREADVTEIAVAIGDNLARKKVAAHVKSLGLRLAILIHPMANISKSARLSPGVVIDALSYIGPNCLLGEGVSVWPSVSVSHDSMIKDYVSLKPNVVIGGYSEIEEGLKVPMGSRWVSYSKLTSEILRAQETKVQIGSKT
jgi:sugar O-acyltransferase (sialic acid O-acetyltransferase NeuD family)